MCVISVMYDTVSNRHICLLEQVKITTQIWPGSIEEEYQRPVFRLELAFHIQDLLINMKRM